ncbi:unnamed protein product [Peniophora sp. CBMAI 1063]|nr:unnamed protein product [Peniophora sp. CBMAI 1063]
MTGVPPPSTETPSNWDRKDLHAGGGARTLFGLSVLRPVELCVVAVRTDPFQPIGGGEVEDIDTLALSAALLTEVDTLRLEIDDEVQASGLLIAIREPVMTALTHVYVTRAALDNIQIAASRPRAIKAAPPGS